jgi:hypothetical protein
MLPGSDRAWIDVSLTLATINRAGAYTEGCDEVRNGVVARHGPDRFCHLVGTVSWPYRALAVSRLGALTPLGVFTSALTRIGYSNNETLCQVRRLAGGALDRLGSQINSGRGTGRPACQLLIGNFLEPPCLRNTRER